jgi:hypothetical protein
MFELKKEALLSCLRECEKVGNMLMRKEVKVAWSERDTPVKTLMVSASKARH